MGGDCTRFQAAQRLICANLPLAPRAGKRVFRLPDILRAPLFTHLMQSSIFRPFQPFSGCQPSQGNPRAAKHRHSGKTLSAIHPNHLPKRAGFRAQIAAARPIRLPALRPRRIRGWRTRWRGVLLVIRRARDCCREEWAEYEVVTFGLAEFLESWCLLLAGDGLLIGAELDRNLFGWEAEPVDVLLDALDELKRIGKDIPLQYFDNIITLLERESRQILEDD